MNTPPLAVISGATGGIGRIIAYYFYSRGWDVLGFGQRLTTVEAATQHAAAWHAPRENAVITFKACDMTGLMCEAVLEHYIQTVCHGRLDALVIAHGAQPYTGPFHQMACDEGYRTVIVTDVLGTMRLCHAALPFMLKQGHGVITILSSFHALGTYPERVPYATAKTALVGLMRGLAVEYGRHNIRTNVIAPGQVYGGRTDAFIAAAYRDTGMDLHEAMRARCPMRRLVEPADIARTVEWLIDTPAMNGQVITLDHGWSASLWHQPYAASEMRQDYGDYVSCHDETQPHAS